MFEGTLAEKPWSDDELRSRFGLDDRRIGLYHEFRATINHSLDDLATSEMFRLARISGLAKAPAGLNLRETAQFYFD